MIYELHHKKNLVLGKTEIQQISTIYLYVWFSSSKFQILETWYTMSGFKLNSVVFLAATILVIVLQLVPPSSQLLFKKFNKFKFGANIDPTTGIQWIKFRERFFSWNQFQKKNQYFIMIFYRLLPKNHCNFEKQCL